MKFISNHRESLAHRLGILFFGAAAALWTLAADPALAVPPGPGGRSPGDGPTCKINVAASERRLTALRLQARGAPEAAAYALPSPLNPKVIVLRVEFSDLAIASSTAETEAFFQKIQDFFVENSYGVFTPTFTVSAVFTLGDTLAFYGANSGALCPGDGNNIACGINKLFTDAITAADPSIDFSTFDHLMFFHAGLGEETSGATTDLWSVFLGMAPVLDGKTYEGITIVPEREAGGVDPLGVICHEYGHQLGLPDLYDISVAGGRSTVGAWDLMDYPYAGTPKGSNPPHLGAWSKKFIGFGTIQPPSTGVIAFLPVETNATGIHELYSSGSESFLAEYRLSTDGIYDQGLAPVQSAGLAVWHIDDSIVLNSTIFNNNWVNTASLNGLGRRGVELLEADGTEVNTGLGDFGNGNGWVDKQTLSSPQTDFYSGAASSLAVSNITGVGTGSVLATVSFISAAANVSIVRGIGYPNPAGARAGPRAGAPAGTLTTLRFEFTRPVTSSQLRLDLHALDGGRIRSIDGAGFNFRQDISTHFDWVYEFDWNGRNESGDEVASGLYLYRLDADGNAKTGKLAIER